MQMALKVKLERKTHCRFILMKNLIILRHSDTKYNSCYVFKAMNPFFSLRSLSADIEQSVGGKMRKHNKDNSATH
ncbi:CLUMA_CG019664, isoform A [Clunio marinus]|uniref:CLUMA_CG019664, isoform A n=1 Tax=Clunio marinus TaxID=568069 RepID=A0A1J1J5H0_9DIPT|nr:CLUMA_CG019664, isoform A [Clunio marinus]